MQIAEHKLQQKQGEHRTDGFQNQPLGFQHIAQRWSQLDLTHQGGDHRGASGQNDGAEDGSHRPAQTRQPMRCQQTCPQCHGQGSVIDTPCSDCRGEGRVQEQKTLSVKVPPGVDNGDRIRLTGEGEAGPNGGPAGDLYVQVMVREHPLFKRDGRHLFCEVPISFPDAALGGELEVPTLDGRVKLKIPPETQTGRAFRLRGKGVKNVQGYGTGDLHVRVTVEVPTKLNGPQKEKLKEFAELCDHSVHPKLQSFIDKAKKFFK